ncbi:MAG: VacB/RNase II family 3'-5' exoribonuclease [Acetobacteraceae bacterium]|nr:VacB/RNase II family 3'-5' exoribonuclease [Acetobacteraceae bacterium]
MPARQRRSAPPGPPPSPPPSTLPSQPPRPGQSARPSDSDLKRKKSLSRSARHRAAPDAHLHAGHPGRAELVEVFGSDTDGETLARPVAWAGAGAGAGQRPLVVMAPEPRGQPALAPGEKVLARLRPIGPGKFEGRTVHRLAEAPGRVLGVYRGTPAGPGRLIPTDRRQKQEWLIPAGETKQADPGELVLAVPLPHSRLGLPPARIIERLGPIGHPRSASLVAIHTHGIPEKFPEEALAEADAAGPCPPGSREDLRQRALVTIDGADARDFDDAVSATARADGGFDLVVAIADVAHYVAAGSALDIEARRRGNSVYFPDRVAPMLPEALSNVWCSLVPGEDRPVLAAAITITADGRKSSHRFLRGIMRSTRRLTYEAAQAEAATPALAPLFAAWRTLAQARTARGTLDLELAERKVTFGPDGRVAAIAPAARLDSHRLIEEFMILANVAAAETLEANAAACIYRIHDRPSDEKLAALRDYLGAVGLGLAPGRDLLARHFAGILARVRGSDLELPVNEMVLRSQAQAEYSTDNIGHFGLALPRYAHFTSPIRRYADLCVHRALIRACRLGEGGAVDLSDPAAIARQVTMTERRAVAAERDAMDRYMAAFMAHQVGETFDSRISGVTRFGIFVTITSSGASGLVPMRALPEDYWILDDSRHTLTGRHSRTVFALGQALPVRLVEANPVTGGLVFAADLAMPPSRTGKGTGKWAGSIPRRRNRSSAA